MGILLVWRSKLIVCRNISLGGLLLLLVLVELHCHFLLFLG